MSAKGRNWTFKSLCMNSIFYTVYRTINLVNGKYYFGVHKTKDPHDDYLGSGTYIKRAVAKHGAQNFRKEVLFVYDDPEPAFSKEDELIQSHRGRDPLCMNLRKGGSGGFDYINSIPGHHLPGVNRLNEILNTNPELREKQGRAAGEAGKLFAKSPEGKIYYASQEVKLRAKIGQAAWTGRKHRLGSRQQMSEKRTGAKNTFFGRKWMWNETLGSKPVKAGEVESHLLNGWVFGRKVLVGSPRVELDSPPLQGGAQMTPLARCPHDTLSHSPR